MNEPHKQQTLPDNYHTPVCAQNLEKYGEMCKSSRVYLSRKQKYKKTPSTMHHSAQKINKEENEEEPPKSQRANLITLAEWLQWAAISLGVGKHVFNNALTLLTQGSQKLECTYALAAASLAIATKLEHGTFISRHHELPAKSTSNVPKVRLADAIKVEGFLLKTLNFSVPVCDRKIELLLSLTERWNLYLRRNCRHLKLPLHLIEAGLNSRWQKRNLTCASYLLDLLSIGASNHYAQEEIYLTAALTTIGAVNCCQSQLIGQASFVLFKYAKCFLKRVYAMNEQTLYDLWLVLTGIASTRLWQKLSLIPTKTQQKQIVLQRQSDKLQWLNQLQFIPFSESQESIDL